MEEVSTRQPLKKKQLEGWHGRGENFQLTLFPPNTDAMICFQGKLVPGISQLDLDLVFRYLAWIGRGIYDVLYNVYIYYIFTRHINVYAIIVYMYVHVYGFKYMYITFVSTYRILFVHFDSFMLYHPCPYLLPPHPSMFMKFEGMKLWCCLGCLDKILDNLYYLLCFVICWKLKDAWTFIDRKQRLNHWHLSTYPGVSLTLTFTLKNHGVFPIISSLSPRISGT